jgi:hypothetical protein
MQKPIYTGERRGGRVTAPGGPGQSARGTVSVKAPPPASQLAEDSQRSGSQLADVATEHVPT